MAESKYRTEKLSQLEDGRSYPITLTSGKAWENETNGRKWWKWMAELPASNPNKQGQYKTEYVYLTHGNADLQQQLVNLVEEHGVQVGNRTKTNITVVKNGQDFQASAAGGAPPSSGGGGGNRGLPGAQDADSVKNTMDLLCVLYAYALDVTTELGTQMTPEAAVAAAKFTAMDAVKGGVVKDTMELFSKFVKVEPLSKADLEAGNEEGDDMPF